MTDSSLRASRLSQVHLKVALNLPLAKQKISVFMLFFAPFQIKLQQSQALKDFTHVVLSNFSKSTYESSTKTTLTVLVNRCGQSGHFSIMLSKAFLRLGLSLWENMQSKRDEGAYLSIVLGKGTMLETSPRSGRGSLFAFLVCLCASELHNVLQHLQRT